MASRFYRHVVQAVYKPSEGVITAAFVNVHSTTAKEFRTFGRAKRTAERLWLGWMLVLFGSVCLVVPIATPMMIQDNDWGLLALAALLWVFSLHTVLQVQGFLRWTYKRGVKKR